MKLISTLAVCLLLFVTGCNISTPQVSNDYNELSKLVLWERQARVRHLYDDLAQTY